MSFSTKTPFQTKSLKTHLLKTFLSDGLWIAPNLEDNGVRLADEAPHLSVTSGGSVEDDEEGSEPPRQSLDEKVIQRVRNEDAKFTKIIHEATCCYVHATRQTFVTGLNEDRTRLFGFITESSRCK